MPRWLRRLLPYIIGLLIAIGFGIFAAIQHNRDLQNLQNELAPPISLADSAPGNLQAAISLSHVGGADTTLKASIRFFRKGEDTVDGVRFHDGQTVTCNGVALHLDGSD